MFSPEQASNRLLGIQTIEFSRGGDAGGHADAAVALALSRGDVDARSLTDDIVAARAEDKKTDHDWETRRQWHTRPTL